MKSSSLLVGLMATREAIGFAPSLTSSPLTRSHTKHAVGPTRAAIGNSILPLPSSSSSTTRLFMGWGPDPVWSAGNVESNFQACPSGSCVSLRVKVDDGTGFIYPGQYVQVKPAGVEDAQPIFLAIASAPTGEAPKPTPAGKKAKEADIAAGPETSAPVPATWEFLIKKTENNDWITSAPPGATLDVSQVMGGGFPIRENLEGFKYDFPAQNLLLFATGSGIAPIRAAIESDQLGISPPDSGGRTCTLYYGVRTPDDMPYVSKFPEWEARGVQVVPVVSRPDVECGSGATWQGRTGYVQNALEEDGVQIPRNSGALLCGVKGMCEGVKSMLTESGVFEGRVMFNF
mmetsp:Transcript_13399/g.32521  ORF Transcript_13399/g.32521 Transcript_13399/m.32521 type:complete len:345 (+) Transcript_13399:43-1077(+)